MKPTYYTKFDLMIYYIPRYGIYDLVNIPSFQSQRRFSIDFPSVAADKKNL